jgi:hypothetical protein
MGYSNVLILPNKTPISLAHAGFYFLILTGFYLLLTNGSFVKTIFFKLSIVGILMLISGILFKILHWPFASPLIITGIFFILIFYSIHFYGKPDKIKLDYFKLIVLFLILNCRMIKIFHFPYGWEIEYMSRFIFLIFILYYIITEFENKKKVIPEKGINIMS